MSINSREIIYQLKFGTPTSTYTSLEFGSLREHVRQKVKRMIFDLAGIQKPRGTITKNQDENYYYENIDKAKKKLLPERPRSFFRRPSQRDVLLEKYLQLLENLYDNDALLFSIRDLYTDYMSNMPPYMIELIQYKENPYIGIDELKEIQKVFLVDTMLKLVPVSEKDIGEELYELFKSDIEAITRKQVSSGTKIRIPKKMYDLLKKEKTLEYTKCKWIDIISTSSQTVHELHNNREFETVDINETKISNGNETNLSLNSIDKRVTTLESKVNEIENNIQSAAENYIGGSKSRKRLTTLTKNKKSLKKKSLKKKNKGPRKSKGKKSRKMYK